MEEKKREGGQEVEEISLKELILKVSSGFRFILSRWIVIIALGILGGVLGFLYAQMKKPIYVASTNFVLEEGDKGGGLGQYAGLASMVGVDLGGGSGAGGIFQGDNILELYKSRKMIEKTLLTNVEHHGKPQLLVDYYIEINKLREIWKKPELKKVEFRTVGSPVNNIQTIKYKRLQDSLLGEFVAEINNGYLAVLKPEKKLNIIVAEVKSPDEYFSKYFDELIVKNVNDFYIQTKVKKSRDNLAILQKKTDSVRNVMNGAIYSAASVTDATPNLNITRQVQRIAPVQRSQFTAEMNKAVLSELVKNLELSKISLLKETPLIQVIDQPVFPLEKRRLGRIKGAFIGGFLTGFLTIVVLIVKRVWKSVMA